MGSCFRFDGELCENVDGRLGIEGSVTDRTETGVGTVPVVGALDCVGLTRGTAFKVGMGGRIHSLRVYSAF
jgi:hypothetical protein